MAVVKIPVEMEFYTTYVAREASLTVARRITGLEKSGMDCRLVFAPKYCQYCMRDSHRNVSQAPAAKV